MGTENGNGFGNGWALGRRELYAGYGDGGNFCDEGDGLGDCVYAFAQSSQFPGDGYQGDLTGNGGQCEPAVGCGLWD